MKRATPSVERDPATQQLMLAMRDGVRLDTSVWLPPVSSGGVPAILLRSPYGEHIITPPRLQSILRYRDSGFAVVFQIIRGVAPSEGVFSFNDPLDRPDGFDTVEWIASQPWSSGAVGMDGSSYLALTQLSAAVEKPPHLKCIIPAVPSADWFREPPYIGGCFSRQHTLNWTKIISVKDATELAEVSLAPPQLLSNPAKFARMMSRPAIEAAEGYLEGDKRAHYRDVLSHPIQDDWWRERTLGDEDYARIDIPTLLISGNFDFGVGGPTVWKGLERSAPAKAERHLLIGAWDHGGCYGGGTREYGPYSLPDEAIPDMQDMRLAYFRKHLLSEGNGPALLRDRVTVYITGANMWKGFDAYPPREGRTMQLHLHGSSPANSGRGGGVLLDGPASDVAGSDSFTSDSQWPHVTPLSALKPGQALDLREREHCSETLVYALESVAEPLTILGEPEVLLFVAADTPDADIVAWLAEERPDGRLIQLAWGALRLRYHKGFDRECLLTPGAVIEARVRLGHVGHQIAAGERLKLLIGGDLFPLLDPNPNTGEDIASAVETRATTITISHGGSHASHLVLPIISL